MLKSILLCTLAGLLCAAFPAQSADFSVDTQAPAAADLNPGTAAQPFKTIQRAADVAHAGDIVHIHPGVYPESVLIRNSGTAAKPIVFESTQRHGAILTGKNSDRTWLFRPEGSAQAKNYTARYVTLRGMVFQDAVGPRDWTEMVTLATGWRMEDCVVKGSPGYYADGVVVRGDDCTLLRVIAEDNGMNGMAGSDCRDLHIQDCILRRNNRLPELPGGNCGACKFLFTTGLRVDGVISYDNFGSGWWLDWDNRDFRITGGAFFGNHAGVYRYPRQDRHEFGQVRDESWSGVGIWSEGNPGPGLIANNVIYSNLAVGIGVMESGFDAPIMVRDNTIVDCDRCIELRAMSRGTHVLGRVDIEGNDFKGWRSDAIGSSLEDTITVDRPADMGITIDGNRYDPGAGSKWFSWYNKASQKRSVTHSLEESRQLLGVEENGKLEAAVFAAPLISVRKDTLDDWTEDRSRINQVPSQTAEKMTIDGAIGGKKVGQTAGIPVFGRKPLVEEHGRSTFEVYDLDGRILRLFIRTPRLKKALETAVLPYASLRPALLSIRLTRLEPYRVEGTLIGVQTRASNR